MKKWDNLFQNYKKIQRFQNASGRPDFFGLSNEERKEHNFKCQIERVLYNEIHAGMLGNHTIFPPNVADTRSPDGVQLPRRGAGVGESVGSEAAGEGFPEERSSTRDSDNKAASGAGGGKRKNARQQASESIADVMERHGELMSSMIESSSKRQCSIFTRQCDILEQEVAVQKAHYEASDETQRMMCHALMEIAAAIRGSSTGDICLARSARLQTAVGEALPAHPITPPSCRPPRSMSMRGTARGKKRDGVPDDSQGQGRGRRQVPKAKSVRSDDASARVPPRGAQGWAAAAEGDYDEDFTTKEEQAEATASAIRESGRQRSSDQSALKRMLTPPPEAQQLRSRKRRTEKVVVVNIGGEDDEPLERRRMRTRTTATPPPAVMARAAVDERPVPGRPVATSSQPRQRNEGGDGGSVQRSGGGEVVEDARAVGGEATGVAGAGASGTVAPVATVREEAAVVVKAREETRGEKKSDREGRELGSSRLRRGVMTKDLIDHTVLWVDDKAFWTTGEGILDQSQLQQAISHAAAVENVALRILHGWVFKSRSRPRGYNVAFQYSLESVATDIPRAMWYGEEWCDVVGPAVCAQTIDLSMDLPLWLTGANIEDRPDDDDMVAHQESTVICVTHAFRAVVQMGAFIDGDFISHDRLCRVHDCFRLLLAACMWIMRMAGDDPRSHYEAFYFTNLVAKPTLVASMHHSFDHRQSVVRATKVVTERLGKAYATFGQYPDYIPQWAPWGIGFNHDSSITGLEDAKKLDWLGSGPPDDDNNNDGKDDA
ncbi:hypothetical protein CBR_g45629 [Chara braunii]|uniref:Uncharacterized protein n=1 Tax=Chara braunii TaxID=69332 RepID=A0A388LZ79_CHABU|nr:hypothetical protein CBR_g45629 [Chara braunii]|eukprot:GBG87571.1 hypothetical protein CBR_g45629 [Chara braunii]